MRLLLLLCLPFVTIAQDSTVCIPPDAARYYLEANDERWVLREKDTLQNALVGNLRDQVLTKDKIVRTYELDAQLTAEYIDNLLVQQSVYILEAEKSERNLRRRKLLEVLAAIGIVIISIL